MPRTETPVSDVEVDPSRYERPTVNQIAHALICDIPPPQSVATPLEPDLRPTPPVPPPAGLTFNDLTQIAFENAKAHGFHEYGPQGPNNAEKLALMHSEISEALEEIRAGHPVAEVRFENGKPEGVPVELADVVIRIADFCGLHGIDLETAIALKHSYNRSRPMRHGKAF